VRQWRRRSDHLEWRRGRGDGGEARRALLLECGARKGERRRRGGRRRGGPGGAWRGGATRPGRGGDRSSGARAALGQERRGPMTHGPEATVLGQRRFSLLQIQKNSNKVQMLSILTASK
jgi:hypothetical protein